MKKVLISGIQPTARPHIGNYFGAMKQFVDLQDEYESNIFIAEYHALTTVQDSATLHSNIEELILDYLAIGIDPNKATLFKQSSVPQVTELTWILNCLTPIPYLERAHAFKDKVAKGKIASMGLFDYPILMAADILLPEAEVVPVGQDQKQHVEMARELAQKFNNTFGETFKAPKELILEEVAIVPGLDGQKMSKSYGNTIPLFAEKEEIEKLAMSVVTSSTPKGEPIDHITDNIFKLHKLVSTKEELSELNEAYMNGSIGYKASKELLAQRLERFISPMRERRKEIAKDPENVKKILKEGGEKMYIRYETKMKEVRKAVGLV